MQTRTKRLMLIAASTALFTGAFPADAGPLDPPLGPILSTGRFGTRVDVNSLPPGVSALHVINVPGSYYLSMSIVGVPGLGAIRIEVSDVTLDLNGLTVGGVPGSTDGIEIIGHNVTVLNGTVRDWDADGINADGRSYTTLKDVRVIGNGVNGADVGSHAIVVNSRANENGGDGFQTGSDATVIGSNASDNTGDGIEVFCCSLVTDCSVWGNNVHGIKSNGDCTITNCSAFGNGADGIHSQNGGISGSTVSGCTVSQNGDDGVHVGVGAIVSGCVAHNNTNGFGFNSQQSLLRGNCTYNNNSTHTNPFGTNIDNLFN